MIENTGASCWPTDDLVPMSRETLEAKLKPLLAAYASHQLGHPLNVVAGLVRPYSAQISSHFWLNVYSKRPNEERPSMLTPGLSSLFEHLTATGSSRNHERSRRSGADNRSSLELLRDVWNGEQIRRLIVNHRSFGSLVTKIRGELYSEEREMQKIRSKVSVSLGKGSPGSRGELFQATFESDWKPLEFLRSQFSNPMPRIGSLVTVTGSALYAYATSCDKYMEKTWPYTGNDFLFALQRFLEEEKSSVDKLYFAKSERSPSEVKRCDSPRVKFQFSSSNTLTVTVNGTKETVVDVAQQLSWLSAALSTSPTGHNEPTYCKTDQLISSENQKDDQPCFKISRSFEKIPATDKKICWLPLFSNATVAWGFPTPERLGEVGLEIPVPLMANLTGARHAVEYQGGIVLKGLSTMLIPTKCTTNWSTSSVQWHLVFNKDNTRRLSYKDGIAQCQRRALLDDVNLSSLETMRAFIGWCSSVDVILGRSDADYDNIKYSGAQEVGQQFKLRGGSLGFQQFALAQVDFALGAKDGRCHFQREGPYDQLIGIAEKTYILLFDSGERRAWLVPASGVLMHVAQHRNWLNPYISGGQKVTFKDAPSFKEQLLSNYGSNLSDHEQYHFKDMITGIWSILEFLLDQTVSSDTTSGPSIKSPFEYTLEGYEFRAVAEQRSPFRRKKCKVNMSAGRWPSLIRDIDALVLFGNGFGDLIKPSSNDAGLCSMWKTVPKNKDYLATTVKIVQDLYNVAGCEGSREYLTSRSHLRWHQNEGALLFEGCQNPDAHSCLCNRVQHIVSRSFRGKTVAPGHLEDKGAVIFGKRRASPYLKFRNLPRDADNEVKDSSVTAKLFSQPSLVFGIKATKLSQSSASLSIASSSAQTSSGTSVVGNTPRSSAPALSCTGQQETLNERLKHLELDREEQLPAGLRSTRGQAQSS
ncbi:hypothetical protein B0T21DRAFT_120082 [Apiosordaria backusii]|uniref:Uncharacterized protein n=1 Tax=Apiosordaria backusii TaxID=314023 RepID=A0AA40EM08_9PEZI|nr:hypothetical protein B0T21DRAFT_120082 [Apiosordaria backusii]